MIGKCEKDKHYYDNKKYNSCPFCVQAKKMIISRQEKHLQELTTKQMLQETLTL